ncbi:zinc finger CCCH domain-containing protein 48 [Citrus sinensis]|nr:zinc finger CCCH domain-containing protein 48 [Citrus sinensis]
MALYSSLRTGYKPKPPPQSQTSPDPPMIRPRRTALRPSHPQISVCEYWISESCTYGDKCQFLHSWVHSDDDSDDTITNNPPMLTKLSNHKKAVMMKINTANNDCDEAFVLDGPIGQVNALVVYNDLLFAGSEDGAIRVWNVEDLECVQTLCGGHSDAVMSLLFWDEYLFSCCLHEQYGVVSLFGMLDAKAKPVLFASCCKDSVIRLYELASFKLRARLFWRREVEAVQIGPDGLFFLRDRSVGEKLGF